MMNADTRTLRMRLRVMMLSFTLRGGFLITSLSTGSTPKLKRPRQQRAVMAVTEQKTHVKSHKWSALQFP